MALQQKRLSNIFLFAERAVEKKKQKSVRKDCNAIVLWQNLSFCRLRCIHQKSLGTGMGGQTVEELERVIAAMRRVVERLQGENDQLKKCVGTKAPQYCEILKENKRLKVGCID